MHVNAVGMSHRLGVLICSTRCRPQVAANEHIKFSLPGNRVELKTIGPPSLPCFPLAALGRYGGVRTKCRCVYIGFSVQPLFMARLAKLDE